MKKKIGQKRKKEEREKKELAKKLTGDGELGNEGKEKQCAEFYDASEIEHKETHEYSSGGTKQFDKENIAQVDIANNVECQGEMSNET